MMSDEIPDLAKDNSRSRIDGGVFEYELAGLVNARLWALARRHPELRLRFAIATNVKGTNPFDDIVLHLRWCPDGADRQLTYFVQLKHKEKQSTSVEINQLVPGNKKNKKKENKKESENEDQTNESENNEDDSNEKKKQGKSKRNKFNLHDYHDGFRKTVDNLMKLQESDLNPTLKILREWFLHDYRLVLLTTKQVLPNTCRSPSSVDFPFEEVFLTGQGEAFSFGESDPEVWHMLDSQPAGEVAVFRERFLRRLRVVSGQAQADALKALLRRALADALGAPPTPRARALTVAYSDFLHDWWKRSDAGNLSHASNAILRIVRDDLHKRLAHLGFTGNFYFALERRLTKDARGCWAAYVVVKDMPAQLRCSALATVLANLKDRCVILTESTFKDYPAEALERMCADPALCSVLLLGVDTMDETMSTFVDKILQEKTFKVIVVSSEWNADIYDFLSNRVGQCAMWSEHWALKHMGEEHDKIAFLGKKVLYQDHEQSLVALKSTWPTQHCGISGSFLYALLNDAPVVLDFPVPPRHSVYLPQKLQYHDPPRTEMASTLWTCRTTTERFVLRGFPESVLKRLESNKRWKKYEPLLDFMGPETSADGDRSIKSTEWAEWGTQPPKWVNKNLHQLTWEGGAIIHKCLIYVSSYKKILGRYVKEGNLEDNVDLVNEQYITQELINKRGVNCLTSKPGMGKSSFLAHMADFLKTEYPLELVIFFRISHDSLMRHTPEDVTRKDIIDLFVRVVHWESLASREAMRHLIGSCLRRSGKVSILIDGFDEVCPAHKGKALRVLQVLARETKFRRLWVTTRPVVEEELTDALACAPFRLSPFSEDDQREYLLRRWGNGQAADGEHLRQRVDRFLSAVRVATAHDGGSMCEVPLYMRMLADTFPSHASTEEAESEPNLSRLKIMQKFVEESRKLFWQRGDVTMDVAENRGLFMSSELTFLHQHKICAAYLIFRNHDLGENFKTIIEREVTTFIDALESEKTGIIVKVSDGSPVFIHRIFAEYFAGMWLAEHHAQVPSLMDAVLRGELEEVRYFLDGLLAEGRALHEAALGGRGDAVAAALGAGAAVDEADAGGRTALHLAAAHAHRAAARELLRRGASLHARDRVRGWTALQYAVALLRLPKLPDKRARPDACSPHLGVVDELLRHGADPRHAHRTLKSKRTLFFALANDYAYVAEAFFKSSALTHVRKLLPTDYMQVAAEHESANAIATLIRLGFDLNSSFKDDERRVPLHIAAQKGNRRVSEDLLQHGARADKQDKHGDRPLHKASQEGHDPVCKLLLQHKAKPNSKNKEGKTPLMLAAAHGHEAVCRTLLDGKARVDVTDANGKTAMKYAQENGHRQVCDLFARRQGEYMFSRERNQDFPLHRAALQGDAKLCRTFLDRGEPLDAKDASGNTALHLCAARGHVAACALLLERGASVDETDAQGNSALHLAAKNRHAAVCEVLVAHNANIFLRNYWDASVYNLAHEFDDVISVLDNSQMFGVNIHHEDESTNL